jgi:hypothetical protein
MKSEYQPSELLSLLQRGRHLPLPLGFNPGQNQSGPLHCPARLGFRHRFPFAGVTGLNRVLGQFIGLVHPFWNSYAACFEQVE